MATAEYQRAWRAAHPGSQYAANKKWRQANSAKRADGKRRNYAQTAGARNSYLPWTAPHDALVLEHSMPDRELSALIGRSVRAIQVRRTRLTGAQ